MTMFVVLLTVLGIGLPGHSFQTVPLDDGSTAAIATTEAAPGMVEAAILPLPDSPARASREHRAEKLWVDRNHQNAISDETTISGDGSSIFASWYLNNPRVSRYITFGTGIPQWTFLAPGAGGYNFDIAGGTSPVWSATGPLLGTLVWLGSGSQPSLQLPAGTKQDISDDGSLLVYANASNQLVCYDITAGDIRWQAPISVVGNGIYGVEICGSSTRVMVSAYDTGSGAQVYSMTDGSLVGTPVGNYGQTKGDISADGSRIVTGDFNGRIRMYQWSGSAWTLTASITTGDSWVTSVAISADGHTVAGGTLRFSPYAGRVLAVNWPSSGTPATMWQYGQYGDEVSSIDICDDGSVIVAGSWGQMNSTSGDVFTAFDHDGAVIFHLLDDVDEPGSILSVAVSADGSFATASGKAVHARLMGSGGEVYGIQIMDAQAHDVGVVSVVSPIENQQVGAVITPQVTVGNFGQSTETFPVSASIRDAETLIQVWSGAATVTSLAPGATANATFSSWTVPAYGSWIFSAETGLTGDGYPANDSLGTAVRAYHDAQVVSITSPYAENTVGMVMTPVVKVKNAGTYTDAFDVNLAIYGTSGVVYDQTLTSPALTPGQEASISMSSWTPVETGEYTAVATVAVADDFVAGNNAVDIPSFQIVFEIIYEDGTWDTYYWVGSLDDDMFATRFTPTIPAPYTATQFRVYVNSTEPFSWAALCPDDGTGKPDLDNPLYSVENLSAPSAPGWLTVPMSVPIPGSGDLWFVTHWPDAKALAVGTDLGMPHAGRSWWHNTAQGWVSFTAGDWSFRLTLDPPEGLGGTPGAPARLDLGDPFPNPAATVLSIPVSVPAGAPAMAVQIYDISGKVVSILDTGCLPAGDALLTWDCTTENGNQAPSGMYFVRLEAPGTSISRKVVLIRR